MSDESRLSPVEREQILKDFEKSFYVRHDHRYPGREIYAWLQARLSAEPAEAVSSAPLIGRLRVALAEALVPLEVMFGQMEMKPYAELTGDLQEAIRRAVECGRAAILAGGVKPADGGSPEAEARTLEADAPLEDIHKLLASQYPIVGAWWAKEHRRGREKDVEIARLKSELATANGKLERAKEALVRYADSLNWALKPEAFDVWVSRDGANGPDIARAALKDLEG